MKIQRMKKAIFISTIQTRFWQEFLKDLKMRGKQTNEVKAEDLSSSSAKAELTSWMDKIPTCSLCKKKKGEKVDLSFFFC